MKKYYHGSDIIQGEFLQFPLVLIKSEKYNTLNSDALVLYAMLTRRLRLSMKNGLLDENNRVYIYYSREEMAKDLRVSLPTARKAVKLLLETELLEEKRQGLTKANRLYPLKPNIELMEECFPDEEPSRNFQLEARLEGDFQTEKDFSSESERNFQLEARLSDAFLTENEFQSRQKKSFSQEKKEVSPSKIYSNKIYYSETYNSNKSIYPSSLPSPMNCHELRMEMEKKINYQSYKDSKDIEMVDYILNVVIGILSYTEKKIRIGKIYFDIESVKNHFSKIDQSAINHTLEVVKRADNVKTLNNYIISVLYNYLSSPLQTDESFSKMTYEEWDIGYQKRLQEWGIKKK